MAAGAGLRMLGRSAALALALALAACAGTPLTVYDLTAARAARGASAACAVSHRRAARDARSRQRPHPRARRHDARAFAGRPLAAATDVAVPRAACRDVPERRPRPLDRRRRRDRRVRACARHPLVRTRRDDLGGPCRGRRQDRGADERPDRRRCDLSRPGSPSPRPTPPRSWPRSTRPRPTS